LGGGIAGLALAERLVAAGQDVVVVEADARPGGLVRSEPREGFLCETGPQAILSGRPDTRALLAATGVEGRILWSREATRRRFIYQRGSLRPLPTNPPALLKTDLLGAMAKLRLAREPFVPKGDPDRDESVLDFCARRFGPEAARAIAAPAVIGIYAGDAANLSVKAALPRLWELEQKHGSVLRGAYAERAQSDGPMRSFSFPEGLEELPRALAGKLGARLLTARAAGVEPVGTAFRVALEPGASVAHVDADRVVLATPGAVTAKLLARLAPAAAAALSSIPLARVAVASLGFRTPPRQGGAPDGPPDLGMDLAAYGFIVARGEGPTLLGCQYESSIFEHRAPPGAVLLRALLGGTFEPAIVDADDGAIAARAVADLRRIAGLRVEPDFFAVWRPAGIPQYDLSQAARVRAIADDLARWPGLHVLGQATTGVGVNDGIAAAAALARSFD
jgi:oxygen-dependent protoporphyrinogen oxidase